MYNTTTQHAWVAVDISAEDDFPGGAFRLRATTAADLPALLRNIRQRIHTDTDRTCLVGDRRGADAAWIAGLMYPYHFASIVVINPGIPKIPYPEQSYAIFVGNLRNTPLLSIRTERDSSETPMGVLAFHKAISDFSTAIGLPYAAISVAPLPERMPTAYPELLIQISKKRTLPQSVQHWFRYLPQSDLGWLRATDLGGEVWDDEQISIVATADTDRDEFITETLKQKLFYLSGKIEGQTIQIETKRLEGIELRLSPQQLDLNQPVTIEINGRKRFEGMLKSSIVDLLECAYETWDFQHLVHMRMTFSIHAK